MKGEDFVILKHYVYDPKCITGNKSCQLQARNTGVKIKVKPG